MGGILVDKCLPGTDKAQHIVNDLIVNPLPLFQSLRRGRNDDLSSGVEMLRGFRKKNRRASQNTIVLLTIIAIGGADC